MAKDSVCALMSILLTAGLCSLGLVAVPIRIRPRRRSLARRNTLPLMMKSPFPWSRTWGNGLGWAGLGLGWIPDVPVFGGCLGVEFGGDDAQDLCDLSAHLFLRVSTGSEPRLHRGFQEGD